MLASNTMEAPDGKGSSKAIGNKMPAIQQRVESRILVQKNCITLRVTRRAVVAGISNMAPTNMAPAIFTAATVINAINTTNT